MKINEKIVSLNENPRPPCADPLDNSDLPKPKTNNPSTPGSNREHDVIMVYMDGLFDTVFGTIAREDSALAQKLLASQRYRNRLLDKFAHISNERFKELYAKRDIETLKHCGVTNVTHFLQRIVKDSMVHASGTGMHQELTFMVNIWPYEIDDELANVVAECVRFHTFNTSRIEVVSISDEDLKPQWVRNEVDIIIRYNYTDWLYMHREEFNKSLCPHVALVVPAIFHNGMPDAEANAICKRLGKSPFEIAEEVNSPIIRLKIMPVSMFCLTDSVNKENAKDIALRLQVQPEDLLDYAKKRNAKVTIEPAMPAHDINNPVVSEEKL